MAQLSAYMCDELHVGVVALCSLVTSSRHSTPDVHDVGLLDRAAPCSGACAPARRRRARRARSRSSCRAAVSKPRRSPSGSGLDAARLAEIDAAGQLAHDHEVEALDDLGLQRARHRPARRTPRPGADWRTGPSPCAAAAGRARAACSNRQLSHFGPPTEPNSTASASSAGFIVVVGERHAVLVERGAADQVFLDVEADRALLAHPGDDLAHFVHDLGADAVAWQHQQIAVGRHACLGPCFESRMPEVYARSGFAACSQGCESCCFASKSSISTSSPSSGRYRRGRSAGSACGTDRCRNGRCRRPGP